MDSMKRLKEEEENWILEDTFNSVQIDETLKKVEMNRRQFNAYLKAFPDFAAKFYEAEIDACKFIENDLLNIHKGPKKDQALAKALPIDPKVARVKLEAMKKILEYRNPAKYSPKVDMNINGSISLRTNLDKANERISQIIRDVTPALPKRKA